jgi:hypothetical protein
MIGLQRSSGLTTINDRKNRHQSSSNIRLINAFKQQENQKLNQQIYPQQFSSRMFNFIFNFYTKILFFI